MTVQTVFNPDNRSHFMHVRPVRGLVRVSRGGQVLAESTRALRIMETGREPYDPVIYVPSKDINEALEPIAAKSTHCPLKGDASYFALNGTEVAWRYDRPLPSAELLADYIAFYADKVTIEEVGAAQ